MIRYQDCSPAVKTAANKLTEAKLGLRGAIVAKEWLDNSAKPDIDISNDEVSLLYQILAEIVAVLEEIENKE